MKTKLLVVGAVISLIAIGIIILRAFNYMDTSFATMVSIKYYYDDIKIDVVVTDEDDMRIIKENLTGVSFADNPSCGFDLDVSISFSDGEKEIVICPACDSCWTARIGDSGRYIAINDRKVLEAVLAKYGMTFPCV
ncbi:MAG: hypothetical protein FWE59_02615 [Oscillospiraceae bacterium]|nr:hypothetical protein [Oscillospiraceae bacterium]